MSAEPRDVGLSMDADPCFREVEIPRMSTEPTVCPKCNGSGVYVGEMGVTLDCEQCSGAASSTDPADEGGGHWSVGRAAWNETEPSVRSSTDPAPSDDERDLSVDFYRCSNTGDLVYRWADARYVLITSEQRSWMPDYGGKHPMQGPPPESAAGFVLVRVEGLQHGDELEQVSNGYDPVLVVSKAWRRLVGGSQP